MNRGPTYEDVQERLKEQERAHEKRIKALQKELMQTTDGDLMALESSLWEQRLAQLNHLSGAEVLAHGDLDSHAREIALLREVRRRARNACWFWRRWRRPHECHKWLDHLEETEKKALEFGRRALGTS